MLLCALLPALVGAAISWRWRWTAQRGGSGSDAARALQVDKDNNLVVAGHTYSSLDGHSNAGYSDVFLMSFTNTGTWRWTTQRGGSGEDRADALQVDKDNNLVVAGHTSSSLDGHSHAGSWDIFLMSFTDTGTWRWTTQRGGSGDDRADALQVDKDNNLVVAGHTSSSLDGHSNAGSSDVFLMSFTNTGTWRWTAQRGGSGEDRADALQVDKDNNLVVAGHTSSSLDGHFNAGSSDVFLMSFTDTGTWRWTTQLRGLWMEEAGALQVDQDNNLVVAGRTYSILDYSNAGFTNGSDVFLMSFTNTGTWRWTAQRGGSGFDYARALQVDKDNNLVVAGHTSSSLDGHSNAGSSDVFLMSFTDTGTWRWTTQRGGLWMEEACALQVDKDNNLVVAGHTRSSSLDGHSNAGDYDIFLMSFEVNISIVLPPDLIGTVQGEVLNVSLRVALDLIDQDESSRVESTSVGNVAAAEIVPIANPTQTQMELNFRLSANATSNTTVLVPSSILPAGSRLFIVVTEVAPEFSQLLPTSGLVNNPQAHVTSPLLVLSLARTAEASANRLELLDVTTGADDPIFFIMAARDPKAGERCVWYDAAAGMWSDAGLQLVFNYQLDQKVWCATTHTSVFALMALSETVETVETVSQGGNDVLLVILVLVAAASIAISGIVVLAMIRRRTAPQSEEAPWQYSLKKDEDLIQLLTDSDVRLVPGKYFLHVRDEEGLLRRRDDPDCKADFIDDPGNLRRIFVVSHPWESTDHADPWGDQLRLLCDFVETEGAQDDAFFYDFTSLKRSPNELCLSHIHILFAHQKTEVLLIKKLAPDCTPISASGGQELGAAPCIYDSKHERWRHVDPSRLAKNTCAYDERGWCAAEAQWAYLSGKRPRVLDTDKHINHMSFLHPSSFESLLFTRAPDAKRVAQMSRALNQLLCPKKEEEILTTCKPDELCVFAYLLQFSSSTNMVTLRQCEVDSRSLHMIMDAIGSETADSLVRSLKMEDCNLSKELAAEVAEAVQSNSCLTSVEIHDEKMGFELVEAFKRLDSISDVSAWNLTQSENGNCVQLRKRQDDIPHYDLKEKEDLHNFIKDADIKLVRGDFFQKASREDWPLPRRQEAEESFFIRPEDATRIIVISHTWESKQHADPHGYQTKVLADFVNERSYEKAGFFFDMMSTYQWPRKGRRQQIAFERCMANMAVLYAHSTTTVVRIEELTPPKSMRGANFQVKVYDVQEQKVRLIPLRKLEPNSVPYSDRGWCCAEKQWSAMHDKATLVIPHQEGVRHGVGPMPPQDFQRECTGRLRFTHRADTASVMRLQETMFLEVAAQCRQLFKADLPSGEMRWLIASLPYYDKLEELELINCEIDEKVMAPLMERLGSSKSPVRTLKLEDCEVSKATLVQLNKALLSNQSLKSVCVNGKGLPDNTELKQEERWRVAQSKHEVRWERASFSQIDDVLDDLASDERMERAIPIDDAPYENAICCWSDLQRQLVSL